MKLCLDGHLSTDASVVALGMFDGVHAGHRVLLCKARKTADQEGVPLVVQTFAQHPMSLLDPAHCPPLLTTQEERVRLMEALGVDIYCAQPFTPTVRDTPPEEFVGRLVSRWKPRAVVIGYNYSFGSKGSGTPALLSALGDALGFRTVMVPAIRANGRAVSATEIRSLLANGRVRQARGLLGRPYERLAEVIRKEGDRVWLRLVRDGKQDLPAGCYRVLFCDGAKVYPALTILGEDGSALCRLPGVAEGTRKALLRFVAEQA